MDDCQLKDVPPELALPPQGKLSGSALGGGMPLIAPLIGSRSRQFHGFFQSVSGIQFTVMHTHLG